MRRIRTNNKSPVPAFLYWASGLILLGMAAPQEAAASYSETVLAAEPIGYWQLNEEPGAEVAADSSGNGFSGTYEGDFVLGGQGPLWDGSESFEAVFDGSTTVVLIEDFFQDLTLEHSFTLEAWVKNRGQPGNSRILSSGLSDAGFGWGLNGAQGFLFTTFAILDYVDNNNPLPADNEWTHYVVTFDEDSDARFYVNGELAGMAEGNSPPNPGDETLTIGSSGPGRNNTEVWNGSISDLAIYDRMLSEAEIRAHYEAAEIPLLEVSGVEPPDGSSSADPAERITLDVSSPDHSVAAEGVEFILNGTDRSADLLLSGDESAWSVQFDGLEANRFYSAEITVTNSVGFSQSLTTAFDTFDAGNFTWEANDWNFENGQFHDNPGIDWSDTPNYFDMIGTEGVDEHTISEAGNDAYRLGSLVGTEPSGDLPREPWASDDRPDAVQYNVGWVAVGEWLNYTRTFPADEYHVYARLAFGGGGPFGARLDRVTSDPSQADQETETLGTFRRNTATGGWQNYVFVPLLDDDGNLASVSLNGVDTLRVTAVQGGYNANYYMLVPADVRPPMITDLSAGAGEMVDSRDGISFNIESDAGVIREDIHLSLNGEDRTDEFTITGDENAWTVSFNNLQPGQNYALAIDVTDQAGNSHLLLTGAPFEVVFETATVVPAAFATPVDSGRDPGFTVQVYKIRNDAPGFVQSIAQYEDLLAGELIDPDTGEPYVNEALGQPGDQGNATFIETGTINYEATAAEGQNFPEGTKAFPGVVPEGQPDRFAVAVTTYLELEAGIHRFGFRHDDGFRLTAGPSLELDQQTLQLAMVQDWDGGAVGAETEFLVEEEGVYAMRLFYYEIGGGSYLEWYSFDEDTGDQILINDTSDARAILAFQNREGEPDIPEPVDGIPAPSIVWDGNNHVISWEGNGLTLERADEITGPWETLEVTSPHTETDGTGERFYRLRSE